MRLKERVSKFSLCNNFDNYLGERGTHNLKSFANLRFLRLMLYSGEYGIKMLKLKKYWLITVFYFNTLNIISRTKFQYITTHCACLLNTCICYACSDIDQILTNKS